MSFRRRVLRSHVVGKWEKEADPIVARMMLKRLVTPAECAELRGDGDEPCDQPLPAGAPSDVACPFRKGHACACRYFGTTIEGA